jgi:hypothetical protein
MKGKPMPEDQVDPAADTGGKPDPLQALQEELNRVGATEKSKGEQAGRRALLKELGFDTKEAAVAWITSNRDRSDSDTELQKRLDAAELKAATATGLLARSEMTTTATVALMEAGVRPDRAGPTLKLVMASLVDHHEVPTPEVVAQAVATFKTDLPEMFTPPVDPSAGSDPSLKPASVPGISGLNGQAGPPGARSGSDPAKAADDAFMARHGKKLGQSA